MEIIHIGGGEMREKISSILKKNGFLIVLFICVCVVGVSTIYISTRELLGKDGGDGKKKDLLILNQVEESGVENEKGFIADSLEEIIQGDLVMEDLDEEGNKEIEKMVAIEDSIGELEEDEEIQIESIGVFQEGEIEFVDDYNEEQINTRKGSIMPVEGQIIQEHSNDTLIYSETLGEWRAHLGIDIKASIGTKVKAALDGEVKKAYYDKLWGNIIILDHGNGLETKYANLNTLEMVKEGVKVKQGDYISAVGKSADIEMMTEDHLHYEVIKNGKVIDPRSIID